MLGRQAGSHRRREGQVRYARDVPVPRDPAGHREVLLGVTGAQAGQLLGHLGVQAATLAGQQVGLEDLADQGMAERVVSHGPGLHQVAVDRTAQGLLHRLLCLVGDGAKQVERAGATDHRSDLEDGACPLRQRSQPGTHEVVQRLGQGAVPVLHPWQQQLGEQGVAGRAVVDDPDEVGARTPVEQDLHLRGGLQDPQPVEGKSGDVGQPVELGQPAPQGGAGGAGRRCGSSTRGAAVRCARCEPGT